MASDAVGTERVSRVVGYKITKGDFSNVTPNLPQRVAIIGEANSANQAGLSTDPVEITSAQQAGELYGYGSPIYNMMRILRPVVGDGIGGIPIVVYPQAEIVAATNKEMAVTVTGTSTANAIWNLQVAGRESLDGGSYQIQILEGDTDAVISQKAVDVINAVLGTPFIAAIAPGGFSLATKWAGETANGIGFAIEDNGASIGVTYAIATTQAGTGTPTDVLASLQKFENNWNTIVVNSYGTNSTVMDVLKQYNGIPDPVTPTGRYSGIIMKPFIALTGSILDEETTVTDAQKDDVTIAICPAPRSKAHPMEAAANMAYLFARVVQDTPHLDVIGLSYPDMPVPANGVIGPMAEYNNRDLYVKKGCSTVDFISGKYRIQDFVTTYHPVGEMVPQFRYCRNLMVDFNVRFGYYLLEQTNVVDKAIAADNDVITVSGVVKPKSWKAVLYTYADDLSARALIVEPSFMQKSLLVTLGTTNPDRLETFFRYKRSGVARIASTTAEAGFNFGG